MDYTSIAISAVIFCFSLSLLAMAWSKKPTKKHIEEMDEAGAEIAKQIQEATEESIAKIENKLRELEEVYEKIEKTYQLTMKMRKESSVQQVKEEIKEIKEVKEQKQELKKDVLHIVDIMKDEKAKEIYELYKQGLTVNEISKRLDMYMGVIQVYVNMFKMNKVV